MQLASPIWIAAGICFCLIAFAIMLQLQKRRRILLQRFAAGTLIGKLTGNISPGKRRIKLYLAILGIFLCFVALARPQYGHHWIDVKKKGIDILFALDTSSSMLAEDIRPNRLERSKLAILDFVTQLGGDRVGLMPFAGSSFVMCPLTVDYSAFEQSLQAVTTDIIPTSGTNLAEAINAAQSTLKNDANHKLLILISDGEDLGGNALQAAQKAAEDGMKIFTVGVGTSEGELIPTMAKGQNEYIKDATGKFVISRLHDQTLRSIATATDGLYAPLGNQGQGLETIYQKKLALIPKKQLEEKRRKVPIERFPWFIGLALLFFVMEYLISGVKSGAPTSGVPAMLKKRFLPTLFLVSACTLHPIPQNSLATPGEESYGNRDYSAAAEFYAEALQKDPENALLQYNSGTAAYKNSLYDEAITSFNKALQSDDLGLQEKAYYNLGNAHFKKGRELRRSNVKKTISHWQDALKAYSSALELQPDNQQAGDNHAVVQEKLQKLRRQQQQQQQNDKDSSKNSQQRNRSKTPTDGDRNNADNQGNQEPGDSTSPDNKDQQQASEQQRQKIQQTPTDQTTQEQQKQPSQRRRSTMTKEEAQQLLKEMKNEEGTLNFIPKTGAKRQDNTGGNW